MIKLKLFLGLVLGISLYGFLSYYQPMAESYAIQQEHINEQSFATD